MIKRIVQKIKTKKNKEKLDYFLVTRPQQKNEV